MKRAERIPAEAFHPGEFVRDELEARGWTAADLADKTHLRHDVIAELLSESRNVDQPLAYALGYAFGNGFGLWMSLQLAWDRWNRARGGSAPNR